MHQDGFEDSHKAISHYSRISPQSSLTHRLNSACLIEGQHYVFRAQFKLLDEDGNPYECDNSNDPANPDPCVIASIYIDLPHGMTPIHLPNKSPAPWNATGWNVYRSDFLTNVDLALAEVTELKIRGPKAGITVLMDNASIQAYVAPSVDCATQFVKNGNLEVCCHVCNVT